MFTTGSPVKGKKFIDRKKHIPIFKAYINNNQHVMIKAPRRFGKTSLIKHVFEHENNYKYIYIDVRRATSLNSLSNQIINKAYSFAGIENFIRKSKGSVIKLLKTISSVKINDIAEVTLELFEQEVNDVELFLHTLDVVDKIAKKQNINIKFVIDEFQDILNISQKHILEQFRSVAQHHENITYIFLGSIESIMTEIFEDKSSAFFHFARIMELSGLDIDELYSYVIEVFDNAKIKYDKDAIKNLLNFLQGHPDYSAQVLQSLYLHSIIIKTKIDTNICLDILKNTILENKAYLEELISKTKTKKYQYEVLHSIANNLKMNLQSRTLYTANIALENMGLIKNISRGKYQVVDIFLNVLLQQNVDEEIALEESLHISLSNL